jgi:CHAT domain-containing protein
MSALILEKSERLAVASLLEIILHKRRPFFAFLSACSTGKIKHDGSVDEGLHLIAACQVAGFQHVISVLWKVRNDVCAEVAQATYEFMQGDDTSHTSVEERLHRTWKKLRADWIATEGFGEREPMLRDI